MSRRPCHYFNTSAGCYRGSQCSFLHAPPGTTSSEPIVGSDTNVPHGVCRFFWEQGRCRKEFNCRLKHVQKPNDVKAEAQTPSDQPAAPVAPASPTRATLLHRLAPFLTEQGLSRMSGSGTDGFFAPDPASSLTPSEAHNALKFFLHDAYRFRNTVGVYAFLGPLNSATALNAKWTQEDGQLLLQTMASQNGLLRLIDIIRWPHVSVRAGGHREVLSFQRGILPILRYLSSDFVIKSTLVTRVNALFSGVLQNVVELADKIESSMSEAVQLRSFNDPGSSTNTSQMGPQVFASIAGVLDECLVRFKNAVARYPRLVGLVKNLRVWFDAWLSGVSAFLPTFDNPFQDVPASVRELLINSLREKVSRLESIVNRELGKETRSKAQANPLSTQAITSGDGVVAALHGMYDPPGELRGEGPRHDNDFIDVSDVRVAPTHQELMCRAQPFLPANLYDAPHPAPADSMQRLLDIQFRLLREELTAPLRGAVQCVVDDLAVLDERETKLGELLENGGGKYHGFTDSHDALMFNVYTNVTFTALVPDRRGLSTCLTIDTPPGRARSSQASVRAAFWMSMSGKRLFSGGLVALIWQKDGEASVHLGTIASPLSDLESHAKSDPDHLQIRVVFFDSDVELQILAELRSGGRRVRNDDVKVLVESPVLFEAVRPFLEALKSEPEHIPFSRYLVFYPENYLKTCTINPPKYACLPNFSFQLASLFDPDAGVTDLCMDVTDKESVERARAELRRASRLDPSQADSVVAALTRELALIQGPPGTGKSFTGVELLRVLVANGIGPILMIAFTNHALDHILCSILDAKITTDIVRLGSRTSEERIKQYEIETREMVAGRSRLNPTYGTKLREFDGVKKEIAQLIKQIQEVDVESDSTEIVKYVQLSHPEQHASLSEPPAWVGVAKDLGRDEEEGWERQGRKGQEVDKDDSMYAFWKRGGDLDFLRMVIDPQVEEKKDVEAKSDKAPSSNRFKVLAGGAEDWKMENDDDDDDDDDDVTRPEKSWMHADFASNLDESADAELEDGSASEDAAARALPATAPVAAATTTTVAVTASSDPEPVPSSSAAVETAGPLYVRDPIGFFAALGHSDGIPEVPSGGHGLDELVLVEDVWRLSRSERKLLHARWVEQARVQVEQNQRDEFDRLRKKLAEKLQEFNEIREEVRRDLLEKVKIIGCTTTGAAKLGTLLRSLSPKVLLVEEAGQVLEAHVLGSLVPSVEHLVLIGDPLQLRPTLNNYALSMDNARGSKLYRFDMSLMERLSTSGLAMSRIDVQRRMRPMISSLIRNTLYKGLKDHELVMSYPDVRGMVKNVFFVTHNHGENGGLEDNASKYNIYEVNMIKDLVLYLLRQGCYAAEGDIVVLCAYLGQLARVRDALSGEVAVIIDERDQADLNDREDQADTGDGPIQHVKVTSRVRLRTVDNYQGEEGKIVILSLVRNSGGAEDDEDGAEATVVSQPNKINIGFLRSENRTNVALSRAREGLYIFGNAGNLSAKSRMWRSIVDELEGQGALGAALPVVCHRHPGKVEYVSRPGQLAQIAPDGGCLEQCDTILKCGHLCPFKCHCDDPNHVAVTCTKQCRKLCPRDHPCRKECHAPCGDCLFPVPNVRLPCGHDKASVPCHQIDNLDGVRCEEKVEKQLLDCEHKATMPCWLDPEDYRCSARCGELMTCCGKECNASCFDCQERNTDVQRIEHGPHPCQTRLYCEHTCQEPCSEKHEHTMCCKAGCRQACPHAQCKQRCFIPCAPCKRPCTWTCSHFTCPVPCGSVCARMPCDERCEKELACGHRCPSVCGEDCAIQVCPKCASDDQKARVVDLVTQSTLGQVEIDHGTLDSLLITIPSCRHTFSVETLDEHCAMSEFYDRSKDGERWLGLLTPTGFRRPPTCPTCRSEITAPRYGRVFKRANLDILERNVAAQMSMSLAKAQTALEGVSVIAKKQLLTDAAGKIKLDFEDMADEKKRKVQARARNKVLGVKKEVPVSERDISPANPSLFAIDESVSDVWRVAMQEHLVAYRQAVQVAETRSAHKQAWDAAISSIREGEITLRDPATSASDPMTHAMDVAKIKVGQPRPLADRRFLVESIWLTLHIRLVLTDFATTWIEAIAERPTGIQNPQVLSWATYSGYLFESCLRDADVAFVVAKDSESHRQISKTALYQMRISLEEFRFDLMMCKLTGHIKEEVRRNALAARASALRVEATKRLESTVKEHAEKKQQSEEEKTWLEDNFSSVARDIVEEWETIERSVRMGTFYRPVSLEERVAIVKASNFAHAGHCYNCRNGHTFVITECGGGATETATCPECDAPIGG